MKKNKVNALLTNQTKRRNMVLMFTCIIFALFIISLSFFLLYFNNNKKQYVSYDENSNIDYKVYLKDNDFFEENYLGVDNQYIASLIDRINADFNYKLSLENKEVEYKYSYRIEAEVDVKEKETNKSLYNTKNEILNKKENITTKKELVIDENINIDYNYYNNLIKKFISIYGLDDTESTLNVNMYVSVIGSCEEFKDDSNQESVMSLSIPLTTKTIAIDISNNLINNENNVMQCRKESSGSIVFAIIGTLFAILGIGLIIITIKYEIKTRTAENIYEKELKKILNNYSSYIQTLGSDFDFKDYQLLKVDTFTDMLEIRDTIRQPILMKENKENNGTYFVIPSNTNLLYVYRLKVSDIQKELQKNNEKDSDII